MLQHKFQKHWKELACTQGASVFLLAVSGGMDSMSLATLLFTSGVRFAVAHCNFSLRSAESDQDEALVAGWCLEHQIVFHHTRFDTLRESEIRKTGIQETARDLRYAWFREICAEYKYHRIITAHHAGDNVETVLMNLFRGAGISGLHGIRVDHDGILRPLLFATRGEIAEYAAANHVPYREDASNESDAYLRNAVRHKILPAIKEVFPKAVEQANVSIGRIADAEYFYQKALHTERKKYLVARGADYYLPVRKLITHPALNTLLYELIGCFGFSSEQLPHIVSLLHAESGHYVASGTHRIIRNREFLVVTALHVGEADLVLVEKIPVRIKLRNCTLTFTEHKDRNTIPTDKSVACIDRKLVEFPLVVRKLKTGDYFYPFGMKMKKKKISRFLIDQKVAMHEKENIWVVESAKRIIWVVGMRIDERFRITGRSEKMIMIRIERT